MADDTIKPSSCPKCGALERRRGKIYQPKQIILEIRFKADEANPFSFKEPMVAFACAKCGFVELYIENY